MPRLLIVDDDEPFRLAMRNAFLRRGYEVSLAGSADEAQGVLQRETPDYAVVDLRMPGPTGLEVVRALRALPNPPQVVVLTGYGTIGDEVEAALLGKRPPPPVHEVPSLDRQEWEYLNRILADCNGNISEAARRLKMHRRTLQRKLQKHPPKV